MEIVGWWELGDCEYVSSLGEEVPLTAALRMS